MKDPELTPAEFVAEFVTLIRDPMDSVPCIESYLFGFELAFRVSGQVREDFGREPQKEAEINRMITQALGLVKLEQSLHQ